MIVLIAHNLRSCHNVGSLLRTAEGVGVKRVYLTGYTPYPELLGDVRLPHIRRRLTKQISKAALGAEEMLDWQHAQDVFEIIDALRSQGFAVYALEQTPQSLPLPTFKPPEKIALVVGREVEGVEPEVLAACDGALEIPMLGKKESHNVTQAAAMALYHMRFVDACGKL